MAETKLNQFRYFEGSTLHINVSLKHKPSGKDFDEIHRLVNELNKIFDKYTTQRPKPHTMIKVDK